MWYLPQRKQFSKYVLRSANTESYRRHINDSLDLLSTRPRPDIALGIKVNRLISSSQHCFEVVIIIFTDDKTEAQRKELSQDETVPKEAGI